MTAATHPITHRRVLKVAIPIVFANATVPILGAVDTGVVGQIGEAAPIGAVGIGAVILSAIYWIFGFLRMGTSGMTAQAKGAGDHGEVSALLVRALLIGFGAGLFFILLQGPLFWAAFQIAPASQEVETLAKSYLQIRIFSAPATIALFGVTGWLIAQERTRAVLALQVWMNGLNIGLDLLFVLQFGWGVEGVAFATFLAEWSGLALGLWLAKEAFAKPGWRDRSLIFARAPLMKMAAVNSDILIRSVLLEIGFVSFLFLGSGFDDVTLAANQVLLQFLHITAYALDGFAFSAEALVGQAFGARNRALVRQSSLMTSRLGLVCVALLSILFWASGPWIIDLMAKEPSVQSVARTYLFWMVLAPLTGVAAWMLDGIFIGATRTADMRNMMIVSFAIYCFALVILVPSYQNHGLWAALIIFFLARGATLLWRYPSLEKAADQR